MKTRRNRIWTICTIIILFCSIFAQSGAAAELNNIRITQTENGLEARLEISGSVNYESFTLFNPNRLIIDLMQVEQYSSQPEIEVNASGVLKIRTAKNQPDVTRVVFDLDDSIPSYSIEERESGIAVIFKQEITVAEKPAQKPIVTPVQKPAQKPARKPPQTEISRPPVQRPQAKPQTATPAVSEEDLFADTGSRSKRLGIQFGGGLYFIHSSDFQDIYGKSLSFFGGGIDFLLPISNKEDLGFALDIGMMSKAGTTSFTEEEVKLKLTPVSFTVYYTRHIGRFSPFAGLGADSISYKEEYPPTFPIAETSGSMMGYNLMLGTGVDIIKSLTARIFFKLHMAKKTVDEVEINLSGNQYGINLIYYFNF